MILWARKGYRIFFGLVFPLIYYFSANKLACSVVLAYCMGIFTPLEIARRISPGVWEWLAKHSFGIFRKKTHGLSGTTYFLIATAIAIAFFHKDIAIACLLFSIFGDAASAIVGTRYGRIKIAKDKSLEGSLSFLAISFCIGFGFMHLPYVTLSLPIILAGSLVATITEALPIKLNDNLSIPIISGIVMELFLHIR
jgi:glycerol-3-phosphate acyltransferase PlsY